MSTEVESSLDLFFLEEGREARSRVTRRRKAMAIGVSMSVTVVWLLYVTVAGHWERVLDNYAAAITMVFGSFVAGSTPQGGGAVAFPVFTKLLEVPAEVARTFSLSIQTIGMGAATAAIVISRRRVEWKAVKLGLPVAAIGFLVGIYGFGDPDLPFRPPTIPGPYIKVSFTLVVGAMALITYLGSRIRIREVNLEMPGMTRRTYTAIVVTGLLGGLAAALTGSGADVLIYLYLAILLAVDPRVGVPTSVIVMTGISVLGFVLLGIVDGQLSVLLTPDGAGVAEVGGRTVFNAAAPGALPDPAFGSGPVLAATKADLFGLWLAAAPIVAWGAPLGSVVASRLKTRQLVAFAAALAAAEIVTTILFLEELRQDPALVAFGVIGALVVGVGLWWIARNRRRVLGLEGFRPDRSLSRRDLDVSEGYRDDLESGGRGKGQDG